MNILKIIFFFSLVGCELLTSLSAQKINIAVLSFDATNNEIIILEAVGGLVTQ